MPRSVAHRLKGETVWRLATGTEPFSVAGYSSGNVIEVDDGNGVIENVNVADAAAVAASRTEGQNVYLVGPSLASGQTALTFEMQGLTLPEGSGSVYLAEWVSLNLRAQVDTRAGERWIRFTLEDANDGRVFDADVTARGLVPTTKCNLLITTTHNDGTGNAVWKMFINGTQVYSKTVAASASPTMSASIRLDILDASLMAVSLERFRAWSGYTSDGDTSGLTLLPGHDISAPDFNTGNDTITKAGTSAWTIA